MLLWLIPLNVLSGGDAERGGGRSHKEHKRAVQVKQVLHRAKVVY
jgi:hypothetical protein